MVWIGNSFNLSVVKKGRFVMDVYSENEEVWESGETVAGLKAFLEEASSGGFGREIKEDEQIELEINIPWWYDGSVLEDVAAVKISGKARVSESFEDATEIALNSVDGDGFKLPFKALSKCISGADGLSPDSKVIFLLPGFGAKKGSIPAMIVDIDPENSEGVFQFTLEIFDEFIE